MKTKLLLLVIILLSTTNTLAEDSSYEWRYYGELMLGNEPHFLFYSSKSINKDQSSTLKVWTKVVATKEIRNVFILNKKDIMGASQKVITLLPSHPEIYKIADLNDDSLSLMFSEYVVNSFVVNQQSQLLNELDCRNEKIRILTIRLYSGENKPIVDDIENRSWRYIAPQTFDSILMSLVCKT